jgi:essential nuclear protein 1
MAKRNFDKNSNPKKVGKFAGKGGSKNKFNKHSAPAKFSKNKNLKNLKIQKSQPLNRRDRFMKNKKSPKVEKKSNLRRQEDEIEEIENENELFYGDKYEGHVEVNEDDWNNNAPTVNLSEILFKKMNAVEEKKMDPRIVQTYTLLGDILNTYTSGKLPKAFNILPVTENWEEIIEFTNPLNWSPQATFEATKMFCSNLNASLAEKFYTLILLPSVRADIKKSNKLNIHYYNCLKKAIFKPSGFFKGIIIPLSDSTTAKEASIIGSIIKKCSIPVAHSAACVMKLIEKCQNKISMGALFFTKMLLLKKYALPTPVKEALVRFFTKYNDYNANGKTPLPVLWHQTLLIFAQTYKLDLSEEEKAKLKSLITKQSHHLISDEIARELNYKTPQINFNSGLNKTMVVD